MRRHLTVSEKAAEESRRGRWEAVLFAGAAVVLGWTAIFSLREGVFVARFGREVLRSAEPVRFWCLVALVAVVSVGLAFGAVVRWREGSAADGRLKFTRIKRS